MRLMAHLSGDPDLLKVFADGGDVFRRIAAALKGRGKRPADVRNHVHRGRRKLMGYLRESVWDYAGGEDYGGELALLGRLLGD